MKSIEDKIEDRIIARRNYYLKNRLTILERQKNNYIPKPIIKDREKYNFYMKKYMRYNRPVRFCRTSIKNCRLHPKFFDEKIMFNAGDKCYLKKIYNPIEDRWLADRAELKYKNRINEKLQ